MPYDHLQDNTRSVEKTIQLAAGKNKKIEIFRDRLKDGTLGPEMVWIPAGSFRMGNTQGNGDNNELPVHTVSIKSFAIGRYEVTFEEYDHFAITNNLFALAEKEQ